MAITFLLVSDDPSKCSTLFGSISEQFGERAANFIR